MVFIDFIIDRGVIVRKSYKQARKVIGKDANLYIH